MGHLWFNGLGIYNLMGGAVMAKEYAQKMLVFRGVPLPVIA